MTRYAKRKDGNHNAIQSVFELMLADRVTDTSMFPDFCDMVVSAPGGTGCVLIEIKKDGKQPLRSSQIKLARVHAGCWMRVDSVEDAVMACRAIRARVQP